MKYEYGAVSSRYSIESENKLTAYATVVLHYRNNPHLVFIYKPEEATKDSWFSMDGKCSERLDEIFGGNGEFVKYLQNNMDEIGKCYDSIKQLC